MAGVAVMAVDQHRLATRRAEQRGIHVGIVEVSGAGQMILREEQLSRVTLARPVASRVFGSAGLGRV